MNKLQTLKILLIEDNPADELQLRVALETDPLLSFTLIHEERLEDGLKRVREEPFDVALVDLGLPDSSGLATFITLHKNAPHLPIIVFSGNEDAQQAIDAVRTGAQDYLVKSLSGFDMAARTIRYAIERQQSQRELRESEQKFWLLFEKSATAIILTRVPDGTIVNVNETFETTVGFTRAESIGKTAQELGLDDHTEIRERVRAELTTQGFSHSIERTLKIKNGDERTMLVNVDLAEIEGTHYIITSMLDITQRKQAEMAQRESQMRMEMALNGADASLWEWNLVTGQTSFSEHWANTLGYDGGELPTVNTSLAWRDRCHPDDLKKADEIIKKHFAGETDLYECEIRMKHKDGHWVWVLDRGKIMERDEKGQPVRMFGTHLDVTELRRAQEHIRQSEEQMRALVGSLDDIVLVVDEDTVFQNIWTAQDSLLYKPREQALGRRIIDVFEEELAEAFTKVLYQVLESGKSQIIDYPLETNGQLRWYSARFTLIQSPRIYKKSVSILVRDITERKKAEQALSESEEKYRGLLASIDSLVACVDEQGSILYLNDKGIRELNVPAENIIGMHLSELFPEETVSTWLDAIRETIREDKAILNESLQQFGEQPRWYRTMLQPVHDHTGQVAYALVNRTDIHDLKMAEASLRQQLNIQKVVAEISQDFVDIDLHNQNKVIQNAFTRLGLQVGVERIFMFSYNALANEIFYAYEWCAENIPSGISKGKKFKTSDFPNLFAPLLRGEVINIPQVANLPDTPENQIAKNEKVASLIYVPLFGDSGMLGFIGFESLTYERTWQDAEINLLQIVGHIIADGLEHLQKQEKIHELNQSLEKRVHELNQADEEATRRQELLEQVIQLGKKVTAITDLDRCLRKIYDVTRYELSFDRVGLFLYDATHMRLKGVWGTTRNGETTKTEHFEAPLADFGNWVKTMQSPEGLLVYNNYQELHSPAPDDDMYGVRQHVSVAVWAGKTPVALIAVDNLLTRRHIKESDIEALQLFAGYAGLAIENARLHSSLELRVTERTAEVRRLYDNAPIGYHSLDAKGHMLQINQTELNWLGYTREELLSESIQRILTKPSYDRFMEIYPEFVETGKLRGIELEIVRKDGNTFPVLVNSDASRDQDGNFLASQMALFDNTERKKAEEALRVSLNRVNALYMISYGTIEVQELKDLSQLVVDTLAMALSADRVNLLLLNMANRTIEHACKSGPGQSEIIEITFDEAWEGLSGWALREEKIAWSPDGIPDERESPSVQQRRKETRAGDIIVVPLIYQDHLLGTITAIDKPGENKFGPDDLDLMQAAANQVAVAIERLRAENNLRKVNQALEHASQAKNDFLANMSHELRTPLNGILGISEILIDQISGPLNEQQVKLAHAIDSSGRHLLSLINDILDLSKIEAGKLDLHTENIIINDVCKSSLAFIKESAIKKDITVNYIPDPNASTILADTRRLKQILINLLSNAVKFTPAHGVVTLQVQANPENNLVEFSIQDTGIGISPEDLQRLFRPFTQVDSSLTRQYEGTGLGLALVKELAELHGGGISVTSEVGKGSCFKISLPWQRDPAAQNIFADDRSGLSTPTPLATPAVGLGTILLAEDVETNILSISTYLEALGYQMVHARNGQEAIQKAEEIDPDLILMDVQMPIMNGLDATRKLRENPRFISTPIIAVTALAMVGDRERCLEAGATEYVSKPIQLKQLATMIKRLAKSLSEN